MNRPIVHPQADIWHMEYWEPSRNDTEREKLKILEKNLMHCHFVNLKSFMD
jgi:hypothetical protein